MVWVENQERPRGTMNPAVSQAILGFYSGAFPSPVSPVSSPHSLCPRKDSSRQRGGGSCSCALRVAWQKTGSTGLRGAVEEEWALGKSRQPKSGYKFCVCH